MYPFYNKKEVPKKVVDKIKLAEKAPLVSVIIPTLPNRKKLLARAIESVLNQTYPNIEIVVEEGGRNVQDARNIAVERSHGRYLAFMDDDDEWYPDKLEKQVKILENNNEIVLCISWGDDYKFGLYHCIQPKEWWTFTELIEGFNISCTSAFMCRRSSFFAINGMDDTLDDSHEYDLAIKLSCIGKVYCIQKSLVRFNQSDDNWSDDFNKKIRGMLQFMQKWGHAFDKKRWFNTIGCLGLFTIGWLTPFWKPNPVHKIFNMTKNKYENRDARQKNA